MAKVIFISAFIGQTVPLMLMFMEMYFEGSSSYYIMNLVLWPSSFLLMALHDNGDPGDDQLRAIAILLNALLYAVIGSAIWFLFLKNKRQDHADA